MGNNTEIKRMKKTGGHFEVATQRPLALEPEEAARRIIVKSYELIGAGNYVAAKKLLRTFPKEGVGLKQRASYLLLVALVIANGNEMEKLEIIKIHCNKNRDNPFVWCILGSEYARSGHIEKARECLEIAKKINSGINSVAQLEKAINELESGKKRISREKLARFNQWLSKGQVAKKKCNYNKALDAFVNAGNVQMNINLVENIISLLGYLEGEYYKRGAFCARAGIDLLEKADCQNLYEKFVKRGDPVIVRYLKNKV